VERNRIFPSKILKGQEVTAKLARKEYLLKIAAPFMDISV
jgi:hypothetical protein